MGPGRKPECWFSHDAAHMYSARDKAKNVLKVSELKHFSIVSQHCHFIISMVSKQCHNQLKMSFYYHDQPKLSFYYHAGHPTLSFYYYDQPKLSFNYHGQPTLSFYYHD